MGIGGNLAADLDQVVVHRRRVADMISAAAMPTDGLTAPKEIGRGEAEILSTQLARCQFAPTPRSDCSSSRSGPRRQTHTSTRVPQCLRRQDSL
jgi:hypothetical protein